MREWPDWLTYGRPFAHYLGAAIMLVLAIIGAFLSWWEVWTTGLPWWGWMLVTLGAVFLLFYAHMRQWRDWKGELDSLRMRTAGKVQIVSMRTILPPHEGYAEAWEMVLQTTKPISPVQIEFLCSGRVDGAKIWPKIKYAPPMYTVNSAAEDKRVGFLLTDPPFLPETPLIVTLETKRPVKIVDFACFDPTPPEGPPSPTAGEQSLPSSPESSED